MTIGAVQAIFFARYTKSNFRAVYGRIPGSTRYTKDYFQVAATNIEVLERVLGASKTDRLEIHYEWPNGGRRAGYVIWSADRYHLGWETNNSPQPWKVQSPIIDPAICIEGDATQTQDNTADLVFDSIRSNPWLIAVKLFNEPLVLHARVFFENPPPNFADRGLDTLPLDIKDAIVGLPANSSFGSKEYIAGANRLNESDVRAPKLYAEVRTALEREPNVLLIGPPGSGKTVLLEDLRVLYSQMAIRHLQFDTSVWHDPFIDPPVENVQTASLVFHPSYSYEDFVGGLVPKTVAGGIGLEAKPGPLLSLAHWIGKSERKALLIIDEFNRGPAAAVFGDTLSLLDKEKRFSSSQSGTSIDRPYIGHNMEVQERFRNEAGNLSVEEEIRLPGSLKIVAAMNSTDRSVAPLDAALRRRFAIVRVRPDYDDLAKSMGLPQMDYRGGILPTDPDINTWSPQDVSLLTVKLLIDLNRRIEFSLGEDFELGHGLVWGLSGNNATELLEELVFAVSTKILPTLRMTFVDQDEALAGVLGVNDNAEVNFDAEPGDRLAYWQKPPSHLDGIAPRRLVIGNLAGMSPNEKLSCIKSILLV